MDNYESVYLLGLSAEPLSQDIVLVSLQKAEEAKLIGRDGAGRSCQSQRL